MKPTRTLCTKEAAALLAISPRTLENWRQVGIGPKYQKIGNRIVRYKREDIEACRREIEPAQ